jgi:hypothetical protein
MEGFIIAKTGPGIMVSLDISLSLINMMVKIAQMINKSMQIHKKYLISINMSIAL